MDAKEVVVKEVFDKVVDLEGRLEEVEEHLGNKSPCAACDCAQHTRDTESHTLCLLTEHAEMLRRNLEAAKVAMNTGLPGLGVKAASDLMVDCLHKLLAVNERASLLVAEYLGDEPADPPA
jgi:hypothetical protein